MPDVTIIQRMLPHYRIPFFVGLYNQLAQMGISMQLIYGQEYPNTVPETVNLDAAWAQCIHNRYIRLPGLELVWQPCLRQAFDMELLIVEQANRLLLNYVFLLTRAVRKAPRMAYWGHGRNMQSGTTSNSRESFKRLLANSVDWWFAYTTMSADTVASGGFPRERITVVQNAIDTTELARAADTVSVDQLDKLRTDLGICPTDRVCVFCGGMYGDKKLDFLLKACAAIRARVPDFHVIMIGGGPEQHKVEMAAANWPWLHYVGPVYGPERVSYFKLGRALLMPGLVGLAIVDSFVTQTPLFTTKNMIHSPEIAYLREGTNGVMTDFSVEAYADAVVAYLRSDSAQEKLRQGCAESARLYTLENMVENFAAGVKACLCAER